MIVEANPYLSLRKKRSGLLIVETASQTLIFEKEESPSDSAKSDNAEESAR